MIFYLSFIALGSILCTSLCHGQVLGPAYPAPTDLTSTDSLVFAAWQKMTSNLDAHVAANAIPDSRVLDLTNLSISIGAFSSTDPAAASTLQYHRAGKDLTTSDVGVNMVDGNSIYRIGSVSKVVTVYSVLLQLGVEGWNRPITDFVTELLKLTPRSNNEIDYVNWNTVTLGALAGQMSGIVRNPSPYSTDFLFVAEALGTDPTLLGFPPVNASDPDVLPRCGKEILFDCPDGDYLQSLATANPIFLPWTSPIYANPGFALLGLALENITGESLADVLQDDIFGPLNMRSSSLEVPADVFNAVVPSGSALFNFTFAQSYGASDASGGVYSTINDLAKFGTAILNSTLLPSVVTRQWLKPVTHTAKKEYSVGRPWEIVRMNISQNGRINDMYTKAGDISAYSAYHVSSPDHAAGFHVLVASSSGGTTRACATIADIVALSMIDALESQAAKESMHNIAGTYQSTDQGLNSSLILSVVPETGLLISSWISNSTDVLTPLIEQFGAEQMLLAPSIPSPVIGTSQRVAFRATTVSQDKPGTIGPITYQLSSNEQWLSMDNFKYGSKSLDLFFFDLDAQGRAVCAIPASTRASLTRVE